MGGIDRALPILSHCVTQLRAIYKVSETDLAAIVTPPKGTVINFFSTNDYPDEALRKQQFGTVGALVWLETTGRVSTCTIIESSAGPTLEDATCNILKRRGHFIPATDVQGKSIRAPIFTRIRWEIPSN